MATPAEALSFLRSNFKVEEDGNLVTMLWNLDGDRKQIVFVSVRESILVISSPIAEVGAVSAEQILKGNDSAWGVSLMGEYYMLNHIVLLENADANEIAIPVELVAINADKVQNALGLGDKF